MSLYKRGNVYWCEWEIGGKRIRETTGASDRQAAQEYHDRRRSDLWRQTSLKEIPETSWDQAALSWIDDHAQFKKSFSTDLNRLKCLAGKLTCKPISLISTDLLLSLRRELLAKKLAPATANRHLAVVSAILTYAFDRGLLIAVPKIPYLPEPAKRFRWLTREKAVVLISELPEQSLA